MNFPLDDSYRPPRWLANPHLQSVLPSSLPLRGMRVRRQAAALLAASREVVLDCGEGVRLLALHASPERSSRRAALLLHGWEGHADAHYMLSLAWQLFDRGFDVVRLNLRDHGGTQHLNQGLFHSCLLPEIVGAVRRVRTLLPELPLHLAGFSLGGNFLLRAAARAREDNLDIAQVVAISPVLEPAATLTAIEDGLQLYHRYFVRKWTASLRAKAAAWPRVYDFSDLHRFPGLRRMTAELVRRFTPFASLDAYLDGYAITAGRLASLRVPATLITALDDPIVPAADLERLDAGAALRLRVTRHGGHVGFLESLGGGTWAERATLEALCT